MQLNDPSAGDTDQRSSMARAMDLGAQVTTISLMMVVPIVGGFYLDRWLGTTPLFICVTLILGVAAAGLQLYQLIQRLEKQGQVTGDEVARRPDVAGNREPQKRGAKEEEDSTEAPLHEDNP